QRGAHALEGYPMITQPRQEITWGELHVGSRSIYAAAGFTEVSRPTLPRESQAAGRSSGPTAPDISPKTLHSWLTRRLRTPRLRRGTHAATMPDCAMFEMGLRADWQRCSATEIIERSAGIVPAEGAGPHRTCGDMAIGAQSTASSMH